MEKSRPCFVANTLKKYGNDVHVLTSEFLHSQKKTHDNKENCTSYQTTRLKTIPYKSNVSPLRFISHFVLTLSFTLWVFKHRKNFDRFYFTAPFALTALISSFFLKKNKIIIDIVDFCPGSLPFPKKAETLFKPLFYVWGWLNRLACARTSKLMSLSSTFIEKAGVQSSGQQILLGATKRDVDFQLNDEEFNLFYAGNIGALYDFFTLVNAIKEAQLPKPFFFHIVGDGHKKKALEDALQSSGVNYKMYGLVYDDTELKSIISRCHYGFNGFLNTTASFSYKSILYMRHGLPLINSMEGDLYDFIQDNSLGYNYKAGDVSQLVQVLKSACQGNVASTRKNVKTFFEKNLEADVVMKQIIEFIND
jgi:glycosyltransferase involved in cell wall biosynthesis